MLAERYACTPEQVVARIEDLGLAVPAPEDAEGDVLAVDAEEDGRLPLG